MVTSYPGRQDEEVLSVPKIGHGGQQDACLPQAPSTQQAAPCSVSLLSGKDWVAVGGTRGRAALLRAVCPFLLISSPQTFRWEG